MEGNYKAYIQHHLTEGFSLVEILVATAIAGILCVATTSAITASKQLSQLNKVKAYLLSARNSVRSWLLTGEYVTHDALPPSE